VAVADRVRSIVEPLLAPRGFELYDVEHTGASLRVVVERPGADLDAIGELTRAISRALDDDDPMPGRYTLEVSSPGLERRLRTPAHFAGAIGAVVQVKTRADVEGERRVRGELVGADDGGITVRGDGGQDGAQERRFRYDEIESARTVFEWGPAANTAAKTATRTAAQNATKTATKGSR
jgi:ribosome maturation factor RimP